LLLIFYPIKKIKKQIEKENTKIQKYKMIYMKKSQKIAQVSGEGPK
jgi:hypothetical protein